MNVGLEMTNDSKQASTAILDNSNKRVAWAVPLLMLAFFAAIFPFTWNYEKHHPDERHYTDAAAIMVASGDYLTPLTPEGDLRLKKPILTYWLVAIGYKFFGISSLTSRVPFLVLGTLIVALTYRAYKEIDNNRQNAFVAACAVAIQPSLIISSMRSIPDVLLTFCLLLSGLGFVRLLNRDKSDLLSLAAAYGGLGLAVEAKGLPALVFGVLAFFFLVTFRMKTVWINLPRHVLAFIAFAVISLSWFLVMYGLHREELISQFFGDQVLARVTHDTLNKFQNLAVVIGLAIVSCLPWSGALLEVLIIKMHRIRTSSVLSSNSQRISHIALAYLQEVNRHPGFYLFACWVAVFLVLAGNVANPSLRYLCAIAPFMACVVATQVGQLSFNRLRFWLKRLNIVSALALVLGGLLLYAASQLLGGKTAVAIGVLAFVFLWSAFSFYNLQIIQSANTQLMVAVAMILSFVPMTYVACRSFANSHFENELLVKYFQMTDSRQPLAVMTIPSHASRIRVASEGKVTVKFCDEDAIEWLRRTGESQFDVMLVNRQNEQCINTKQYQLQKIRDGYVGLDFWPLMTQAIKGRGKEYLREHEQNLTLAVRRPLVATDEFLVTDDQNQSDFSQDESAYKGSSKHAAIISSDPNKPIIR